MTAKEDKITSDTIDSLYKAYVQYVTDELTEVLTNCGGNKSAEQFARQAYRIEAREEFEQRVRVMSPLQFQDYSKSLIAGYEAAIAAGSEKADRAAAPLLEFVFSEDAPRSRPRPRSLPGDGTSEPGH